MVGLQDAAFSMPASNGMVHSAMWIAKTFLMTLSSLSSVTACVLGEAVQAVGKVHTEPAVRGQI